MTDPAVEAVMRVLGCERVWDDLANAGYCGEHNFGWLTDNDCCPRAERVVAALYPVMRKAKAEAWDEGARHGLKTADWEYGARVNQPDPTNPYAEANRIEADRG